MPDKSKGKGLNVTGVPLPGNITQAEGGSAEPNRTERKGAFKTDDDGERYAKDYFDDENELEGDGSPLIANKNDEEWSEGIEDEENETEDADDQAIYPEIQPLHVIDIKGDDDEEDAIVLRPDNIQKDSA